MNNKIKIIIFFTLITFFTSCWNNISKENNKEIKTGVEEIWWFKDKIVPPPKNNFISIINKELWEE